jgi:hypothetical protein
MEGFEVAEGLRIEGAEGKTEGVQ